MSIGVNDAQREAVEYLGGPLVVYTGSGTGKTKVVIHKIAHLVERKGLPPEGVEALTFSVKTAEEMEKRLKYLVPGKLGMRVSTFHSFSYDLFRSHGLELGLESDPKVLTDEIQQAILLEHFDEIGIRNIQLPANLGDLVKKIWGVTDT